MEFVIVYPVGVLDASVKVWKPGRVCRRNLKKKAKQKPPFFCFRVYPEIITQTIDKRQLT